MNLVERAKNILMAPAKEWEVIKGEPLTPAAMFKEYAMILAAIPMVAGFIGQSLIGTTMLGMSFRQPFMHGLVWAILFYVFNLGGVYVMSLVIDALAPTFGATKDPVGALKIAVFSNTAGWVAGIFQILPMLGVLAILGFIYSLYLLYVGLKTVKTVPPDKLIGYFVAVCVAMVVIYFVVGALVGAIALSHVSHASFVVP